MEKKLNAEVESLPSQPVFIFVVFRSGAVDSLEKLSMDSSFDQNFPSICIVYALLG